MEECTRETGILQEMYVHETTDGLVQEFQQTIRQRENKGETVQAIYVQGDGWKKQEISANPPSHHNLYACYLSLFIRICATHTRLGVTVRSTGVFNVSCTIDS